MKKYLLILVFVLFLSPQMAFACTITFDQNPITAGQGTYLRWTAEYFYGWSLQITNIAGIVGGDANGTLQWGPGSGVFSGSIWVAPGASTNYTGTVTHFQESNDEWATYPCRGGGVLSVLNANPPPPAPPPPPPPPPQVLSCSISFGKNPINRGESTSISWSSTKATLFFINGIGYVGGSGSARISPGSTSDFGGYVSDASGATVSCPATLTVSNSCPPGQVLINGTCTQQCPPGFTYRNGECIFIGCPLGYVRQGNTCVFSACPAGYVKDGDACVEANQCTTPPKCVGNDLVNSCNDDTIATCDWGCAGGACNPVPAPSGVINASPKLLDTGNTSTISWSASNVRACTITGTNGDAWTGNSSSGKTSKPIQMQTTYYLRCDGYSGSSPASIDKSVIINIIPTFNEK